MSRKLLAQYATRMKQKEEELCRTARGTAMLLHDAGYFARKSIALPVEKAGNKEFAGAVSTGGTRHFFQNQINSFSHNKRGLATTAAGTAASVGTGIGVGVAVGGGVALVAASAAITGGIAVGVFALGIGIAVGINAYGAYQRGQAHERTSGQSADERYDTSAMVSDLEYMLNAADLEALARYQDKAIEAGKLLDRMVAAPVANCGDAATLAYGLFRFKHRLEEKLDKGRQMDHLTNFVFLVDNKIAAASQMCSLLGEIHTANLVIHLAKPDANLLNPEQKKAYGKSVTVANHLRDYNALAWKTWFETMTGARPGAAGAHVAGLMPLVALRQRMMTRSGKAEMEKAFASILKEAKNASDGDHNDVSGKVQDALAAAGSVDLGDQAAATRSGHVGGTSLKEFSISQLQGVVLGAGKTAATSASVSSALGSSAIGSTVNIAASGGAGLAAGIVVSALVGYALELLNDRSNIKAIYGNTVTDPAQRIWLLRSMLKAGRIEAMADSIRKCQESIAALQAFYADGSTMRTHASTRDRSGHETTHADMVTATKHLFRLQKHMLKLLAANSVLGLFYNELYGQVEKMITAYSAPGGAADQAIDKIKGRVEQSHHAQCAGTCYHVTSGSATGFNVAHRLKGAPNPA